MEHLKELKMEDTGIKEEEIDQFSSSYEKEKLDDFSSKMNSSTINIKKETKTGEDATINGGTILPVSEIKFEEVCVKIEEIWENPSLIDEKPHQSYQANSNELSHLGQDSPEKEQERDIDRKCDSQGMKGESFDSIARVLEVKVPLSSYNDSIPVSLLNIKEENEYGSDECKNVILSSCNTKLKINNQCSKKCEDRKLKNQADSAKLKIFKCADCNQSFRNKSTLSNHKSTAHPKPQPFKCTDCDRSFKFEQDLSTHIKAVHKILNPYKCLECNKSFADKNYLSVHTNAVHRNLTPVECMKCKQFFNSEKCTHIKSCPELLKPYECTDCGKFYATKYTLSVHTDTIHRKLTAPVQCMECKQSFNSERRLSFHIKTVHKILRPYTCMECNKSFAEKNYLSVHINANHKKPIADSMSQE